PVATSRVRSGNATCRTTPTRVFAADAQDALWALQLPPPEPLVQVPDIFVDPWSAPLYLAPTVRAPNLIFLPRTPPSMAYLPAGLASLLGPRSVASVCFQCILE